MQTLSVQAEGGAGAQVDPGLIQKLHQLQSLLAPPTATPEQVSTSGFSPSPYIQRSPSVGRVVHVLDSLKRSLVCLFTKPVFLVFHSCVFSI